MTTFINTFGEERSWQKLCRIGGYAALLSFCLALFDLIFGFVTDVSSKVTAVDRFSELKDSTFIGLYHLDFLKMINSFIMIPVYFSLYAIHRRSYMPYITFAILLALFGTMIFIINNPALPMLELSHKFHNTMDVNEKIYYAAAGEAVLSEGSTGSFGYILVPFGNIFISVVMLKSKIFRELIGYFGLIGNILILLYVIFDTVIIAVPGGLLYLMWILLIGLKLIPTD